MIENVLTNNHNSSHRPHFHLVLVTKSLIMTIPIGFYSSYWTAKAK